MALRQPARLSFDPASIRGQLERILAAPQFSQCARMCRFLCYCVEHAVNGHPEALKEYSIGVEVFDRTENFDPRLDSIVRVEAQRLRRKLREYYGDGGAGDPIFIEFPAGRYVPLFQSPAASAQPAGKKRIAVLPFANLSDDPSNEYFADGLTEELIGALGRAEGLQVVARSSAFVFKGLACDLKKVAEILGVSAVVEGSVRKSGGRLRIAARLADVAGGVELWCGTYDSRVGDFLQIQEEIATRICEEMCPHFPARPARRRQCQVVELCLKGRYFWRQMTPESLQRALRCFEDAIALDADCPDAHAGVAETSTFLTVFGALPLEALEKAQAAAGRAVALDPTSAPAHVANGFVQFSLGWDWSKAERSMRRALELSPGSAFVLDRLAWLLPCRGKTDEAVEMARGSVELDPISAYAHASMGAILCIARRYEEAGRCFDTALELDPNFYFAYLHLGILRMAESRYQAASACFKRAMELAGRSPALLGCLAMAQALAGNPAESQALLEEMGSYPASMTVSSVAFALAYAGLGERDKAFDCLRQAFEQRTPMIHWIELPIFDTLRADPRLAALRRRAGLPAE